MAVVHSSDKKILALRPDLLPCEKCATIDVIWIHVHIYARAFSLVYVSSLLYNSICTGIIYVYI
jgi:hypothetical protein